MREDKIAILIPTFNGGALLAESVASAAAAGLPPDAYEIVVIDNASTDGSIEMLPSLDRQGAPVAVRRNGENLGRVENWNRAIELAEAMGFGHVLFLMVGDLVRDASVMILRDRMRKAGAALGIASYEVVDASGRSLRLARRIDWRAGEAIALRRFLQQSLCVGGMLFGPLGANLYDLRAARLRFDPADPTHTDQAATIAFLREAARPIVYLDRPITQWRERPARFHATMNIAQRLAGDIKLIMRASHDAGVIPDGRKLRCTFVLRILFHARGNLVRAWPDLRRYARKPQQIAWLCMLRMLLRKLIYKTPWRITR